MSFKDLKKNRGISSIGKINQQIDEMNKSGGKQDDPRFWKLTTDKKTGNGAALIRFLPAPPKEDFPFVKYFSHAFEGPGGWYIENSRTSLGSDTEDPVSQYNRELYQTGLKANEELAKKQKRKLNYVANILVVNDPDNAENNGKVFLFKFGKKIFDKINEALHPVQDKLKKTEPMNPFCPWEGANFELRARKVDKFPNYDTSAFETPTAIGTDEEIEAIYNQEHSLTDILKPENFKSYDELKKRLDRVLGLSAKNGRVASGANGVSKGQTVTSTVSAPATAETDSSEAEDGDVVESSVTTTDEDLDFLNQLAEGED